MPRLFCLEIFSYRGISIGAIHYYGKLNYHSDEDDPHSWSTHKDGTKTMNKKYMSVKVTRTITEKVAEEFNKLESDWDYTLNIGEDTGRFDAKEDVITHAIKMANELDDDPIVVHWRSSHMWESKTHKILHAGDAFINSFDVIENDRLKDQYLRAIDRRIIDFS